MADRAIGVVPNQPADVADARHAVSGIDIVDRAGVGANQPAGGENARHPAGGIGIADRAGIGPNQPADSVAARDATADEADVADNAAGPTVLNSPTLLLLGVLM